MRYQPGPVAEDRDGGFLQRSFLAKLAKTPDKTKRLTILKACSKVGSDWVEHLFWECLEDPCEEIRDFIVKRLSEKDRFDLAYALARLEQPPWYAKSAVLRILGSRKIRLAVPYIEPSLGDENVDVRRSAALALGEIGGQQAIRLLVRLMKDSNPYVRSTAEESIDKASSLRFI